MQNPKPTPADTHVPDRLSYLWLVVAIVLLPFGTARWTIPLAAWLYPVFLLRFVRTQNPRRGILLAFLATVLVLEVAWFGFLPMPEIVLAPLVLVLAIVYTLPYLIDRVIAPRLGGLLGSLVFPLAMTTVWYLWALGPWGTTYNPAYTQYGNLPLLQLLSVTGLWGLVFLMSWFAGVVNWAWERGFAWSRVRGGAVLYASILGAVLLFGGARLALFPAQGATVRVAGISPSRAVTAGADQQFSQLSTSAAQALMSGTATQAERQIYGQASIRVFDNSLSQSEQEAQAGAKIILWPEYNGGAYAVLEEDEAGLLAKASALARRTGTYLDLDVSVILLHAVGSHAVLDQAILIDPTGNIVWRYEKAHPVFLTEDDLVVGDGHVPTVQTPYGRLSSVVCNDDVFQSTLRQAGQAGADIMLIPANDWQAYDTYHTQQATYRAIENGYSLVRQDSHALAMTVDYEGNVLAASDYFTTDPQVMVAYVPIQGVRTLYAMIGDLFAWLSMAGLIVLIGLAIVLRRQAGEGGGVAVDRNDGHADDAQAEELTLTR